MNYYNTIAKNIKAFTKRDELLNYLRILNRSHSPYELSQIKGYM